MNRQAQAPLSSLLEPGSIRLDAVAIDRDDAVRQTGQALVDSGAVDAGYIETMLDRERAVSTFVGEEVAFPHGTLAGKHLVTADAISVLRFPSGVDWNGSTVRVCIGIAARGNGHIALLSRLATLLLESGSAGRLRDATTAEQVYALLNTEETS